MADIDVPFNFDPVDNLETSTTYTVGSGGGDYALVEVTLSAVAYVTGTGNGSTGIFMGHGDSNSTTISMKLKAGAVLTKTETAASATTGTIVTGTTGSANSYSEAIILVDGVSAGSIRAHGAVTIVANTNSGTGTVAGSAQVTWHIAEYNSIS